MKENRKITWTVWLQILIGAVFTIGMLTFLKPCGPKEDGTWMNCHYAGQALLAAAAVMLIVGLAGIAVRRRTGKICLAAAQIVLAILVFAVPGQIGLCMMPEMRCRAVMRPGASVFAVLMILCAAAELALNLRRSMKK